MSGIDCIFEVLKKHGRTIRSIVKRGYVSRAGDDSGPYNITQVSFDNPLKTTDSEVISPYGLYVNLPEEVQVLLFSVCSDEENKACIGYSQDDRFKNLKPGEVLIGNPAKETFVKFDNDGNIEIQSKGEITIKAEGEINIESGDINIENGTINVTGDADINANNVHLNATKVDLGVGGNNIARVGDPVSVSLTTGLGTITAGGNNTSI